MRMRSVLSRFLGVGLTAALVLAGADQARAVTVDAYPTWPIPSDASVGPPPIPTMPLATAETPPASAITDPVTAGAGCGNWHLQNNYGGRWPAASTWWEYRCTYEYAYYYNTCTSGACNAFCPECYWETQVWSDHFFWNGSDAVFYGEAYSDSVVYDTGDSYLSDAWWDGPTAHWYKLGPYSLTVSNQGTGSGQVTSSPAGISCGFTCQAGFDAGTTVTLAATADASSSFTAWSGDCSGTGDCNVTMDQARSVSATFNAVAPANSPPVVTSPGTKTNTVGDSVSYQITATDPEGHAITGYGASGLPNGLSVNTTTGLISGTTTAAGTFGVTITATDDRGATGSASFTWTVNAVSSTLTFAPNADTYVRSDRSDRNFGTRSTMVTDATPTKYVLVKFTVSGTGGKMIKNAKLRLYCVDASPDGGGVYPLSDNSWQEGTVTWNNQPAAGSAAVASLGAVSANSWYEVDVTSLVTGDGTYSIRIVTPSGNSAAYSTKEGAAGFASNLLVTLAG